MGLNIDREKCTLCGDCISACPFAALEIIDGKLIVNNACTVCGICVDVCQEGALSIERTEAKVTRDNSEYKGVAIFAEQEKGNIHSVAYELLGIGRKLADKLNVELTAYLLGNDIKDINSLFHYGADRIVFAKDERLDHFNIDRYTEVITKIINKEKPEIFLGGATFIGRSLLSRIAVKLKTGLTADCTGLDVDDKRNLIQTRPAFGGNIMAEILTPNHRPQMATVRHKVMKPMRPDESRKGRIIEFGIESNLLTPVEFIDFIIDTSQKVNLAEADIIVSGGRGLGGPEHFDIIEELASLLNGAVGASRAAVDAGWIPYSHQVGQTGRTVSPKMYMAIGISGAIQHLVGMQSSDFIVAINKDPEAPIFKVADLGIVGDLFDVVPALIKEIKKRKGL